MSCVVWSHFLLHCTNRDDFPRNSSKTPLKCSGAPRIKNYKRLFNSDMIESLKILLQKPAEEDKMDYLGR